MEKHEKIFFTETIRPGPLRFGMLHHLVDLLILVLRGYFVL